MKFYTADRQTWTIIDEFDSIEEAREAILSYEEDDRNNDWYEDDFYDIIDETNRSVM